MKSIKFYLSATLMVFVMIFSTLKVDAHCQIPCGIYDDYLRIQQLQEHISTIEKSMQEINGISNSSNKDLHSLIRWVNNKEEHAKKIQFMMQDYFLSQRIKSKDKNDKGYSKYVNQLTLSHSIIVLAMKARQTTDLSYVKKLRKAVEDFTKSYFSKEEIKAIKAKELHHHHH